MARTRKADALQEAGYVEQHEPRGAGNLVEADRAQHEAEADREDRLGDVVAAEAHEGGEGQQHQREDLGRAEGERHVGQQRREGGEEDVGDRAADERGERRRDQREARTALPGQGRPSNVVATAVEAPGMPSVTDEIAPPYIAP
jgi:hypothetical protein